MAKAKLYRYSDGNTHTDNLTLKRAKEFRKMQNGGRITPMSMLRFEDHPWTDSHLAACGPCMMEHDKQLPNVGEERNEAHDTHTPEVCDNCSHQQCATVRRNRKRAAAQKTNKAFEFVSLVARMKTEEEYGDDGPSTDDWFDTLNNLIASARKIEAMQ